MDGVLLIHKEAGMTSHDVVGSLRRILHMKKIGHSGTLDPDATGVLLVLLGTACKVLPFLEDTDKEYICELQLGRKTVTDDVFGDVLEEAPITPIPDLQTVLQTFLGKQKQLPPMVSSVRVNGKKLYEYARNNEVVERPLRDVEFYALEVLDESKCRFRVACSSGTFIRSLCVDIAEKTGNLGCMRSLIRSHVGRFSLEDCVRLEDVSNGNFTLHSIEDVLSHIPCVAYEPIADIYHGKHVPIQTEHDRITIIHEEKVVAVYERDHNDIFRSVRGLW